MHDLTLLTLALAIALGWSLHQVAAGISDTVTILMTTYPSETGREFNPLTWRVGDRYFTILALVQGMIQLAVTLGVAALVHSRRATRVVEDPS